MKRKILSIIFVVMLLSFPAHTAYAATQESSGDQVRSGDVSDWASLFGWLSDINGHLGLIYGEVSNIYDSMDSIDASVNFNDYFNHTINGTAMYVYLNQMFSNIGAIHIRLGTIIDRLDYLESLTGTSGRLGLYDVIGSISSLQSSLSAIATTNTYLSQLMSTGSSSSQTRLIDLYNKLDNIYSRLASTNSYLSSIDSQMGTLITAVNNLDITQTVNMDMTSTNALLTTANSTLTSISDKLTTIRNTLNNVNTSLNSVVTNTSAAASNVNTQGQNIVNKLNDVITSIGGISSPDVTVTVDTSALERLVNTTNNQLTLVQGQLDRILLYLIVSDVEDDLIGDFDWIQVQDDISSLTSAASNKMPFAALGFFGSITGLAIFSSQPAQLPEITIPFGFAGTNNSLTISNAMMNAAQPYIHFAVLLMFMYCLAVVTLRFVYRD